MTTAKRLLLCLAFFLGILPPIGTTTSVVASVAAANCSTTSGFWDVDPHTAAAGDHITLSGNGTQNNGGWSEGMVVQFYLHDASNATFFLGQATVQCTAGVPYLILDTKVPAQAVTGNAGIESVHNGRHTCCMPLQITAPSPGQITLTTGGHVSFQVGETATLIATVLSATGTPLTNTPVEFHITGANPTTYTTVTNGNADAQFSYTGTKAGTDTIVATSGATTSNEESIDWRATSSPPPAYTVSGTVYVDANQNGVQNAGEAGYGGATITLGGNSTNTNSSGAYSFSNVSSGSYDASLNVPPGFYTTTSNPVSVSVSANTTINFGIAQQPASTPPPPTTDQPPFVCIGGSSCNGVPNQPDGLPNNWPDADTLKQLQTAIGCEGTLISALGGPVAVGIGSMLGALAVNDVTDLGKYIPNPTVRLFYGIKGCAETAIITANQLNYLVKCLQWDICKSQLERNLGLPISMKGESVTVASTDRTGSGCTYFVETRHNLCGGFRSYWEEFGGLAVYGYPLTDEFIDPITGLVTQYFERTRFEWHPGEWPARYDVMLGLLGNEVTMGRELSGEGPFQKATEILSSSCVYFKDTGHNLCNGFLAYIDTYGGVPVYGLPISEEFQENGLTVQYFERQRVEWHPGEWPARYDVMLGRLGGQELRK